MGQAFGPGALDAQPLAQQGRRSVLSSSLGRSPRDEVQHARARAEGPADRLIRAADRLAGPLALRNRNRLWTQGCALG